MGANKPGPDDAPEDALARGRWAISDELRRTILEGALHDAVHAGSERERQAARRLVVAMEAQNQADEHLAEKHARIDGGLPTERVGVKVVSADVIEAIDSAERSL